MKGIRFYLEHDSPSLLRKGQHTGNCVAVITDRENAYWTQEEHDDGSTRNVYMREAVVPLYSHPDSAVCGGAVRADDLGHPGRYKRISEDEARALHPALFAHLDPIHAQWVEEEKAYLRERGAIGSSRPLTGHVQARRGKPGATPASLAAFPGQSQGPSPCPQTLTLTDHSGTIRG